ncbi:MAG: hypothetical protein GIKADHBN_02470 [Phycisphaerales bacterium]|nr:hypothetical protein [Phycisphaerales bacterium]
MFSGRPSRIADGTVWSISSSSERHPIVSSISFCSASPGPMCRYRNTSEGSSTLGPFDWHPPPPQPQGPAPEAGTETGLNPVLCDVCMVVIAVRRL